MRTLNTLDPFDIYRAAEPLAELGHWLSPHRGGAPWLALALAESYPNLRLAVQDGTTGTGAETIEHAWAYDPAAHLSWDWRGRYYGTDGPRVGMLSTLRRDVAAADLRAATIRGGIDRTAQARTELRNYWGGALPDIGRAWPLSIRDAATAFRHGARVAVMAATSRRGIPPNRAYVTPGAGLVVDLYSAPVGVRYGTPIHAVDYDDDWHRVRATWSWRREQWPDWTWRVCYVRESGTPRP